MPLTLFHRAPKLLISLSLILYPISVLAFKNINGLIYALMTLAGIFLIIKNRNTQAQASRDESLLYFSVIFFFIVALLATINTGFVDHTTGKFLHLLLLIPVYVFLRNSSISLAAIWYGLILGAYITAGLALYESSQNDWALGLRVRSITHPIIFGDIALIMGCMSMASLSWFKKRANWQIALPVLALICSLVASILSGSRGSWLAIPFIFFVLYWPNHALFSKRLKTIVVIACTVFALSAYLIPQTQVQYHLDRTYTSINTYADSDIDSLERATSVGTRFEMWQASWKIFLDNPLLGVGWGHYKKHAQLQVDQGLRNPSASLYGHPHNQFFSHMASSGSLGLISILMLFIIPARLFIKYIKQSKSDDIRSLAIAGLMLVIAYMCFAFSEAVLERSRPVNFYAFYLAVFMAAIAQQLKLVKQKDYQRKHRLSVIIIAQNEADRIEDCLKSVANWADEIIVLDSGSTDNTIEITKRYTDKIFHTDWPGYGPQKQRALEKAQCDWVLSIDADERLTEELRSDIDKVLSQQQPDHNGYQTPWAVMLYGHRMDFGRSARAPLRLFKRAGAHFTDAQVHERIILAEPQTQAKLDGRLLHFTHRDFGHGLLKSRQYAWLGSQKYFSENRWGGGLIGATLRAFWTFFLIYFLRLGVLDGAAGFLSAASYAQNSFNKYAGLWSLQRTKKLQDKQD